MKLSTTLGAAIAALMLPVAASATNGYFTHGIGVRSLAVGGVGAALPQDGLSAALNPAATALLESRLDLGVAWFRPQRGAQISGNFAAANGRYDGNDTEDFFIPELGYVRQLTDKLSAGLAIYGNGGMNTDYGDNPFAAFGSTGSAGVNLEQLFVTPSLAYKPHPDHAFGVAVTYAYQRFEMKGISAFANPNFSVAPGSVSDRGRDSANGWGLKLGWIGQVTPTVKLGASWSSELDMQEFGDYRGLFAENGDFDIPATVLLGVAWQASPVLTLAADWQRIDYSSVKSVGNPLQKLLEGNALGSANGAGFGWKDIDILKLGAIYQFSDSLALRAGLSRSEQPIPRSETFLNILAPGTVRDHLTLGASWKTSERGEWSISYAHAFKETVQGQGSIPMPFGGGEANIYLQEDLLSIGYSFSL